MQKSLHKDGDKSYFMTDSTLYFWWVFSKQGFLPDSHDYFGITEVLPAGSGGARHFRYLAEHTDIDKRFDVGFYSDGGIDAKIPKTKEAIGKYSPPQQKIIKYINKRFAEDKCLNTEAIIFTERILDISTGSQIYFRPDPSVSQSDPSLKSKLDVYIQEFLAGELLVQDRNYYSFEKQKDLFIREIRAMKAFENYSKNFVVGNKFHYVLSSEEEGQTLFLHTLYALEFLGFIEVLKIWFYGNSSDVRYFANILPNESFKQLVYDDYKKENPSTVVMGFDSKTDTLTFGKKKIQFSKGKKETDAVLLIRTLTKQKNADFLHEDEILEEWGYRTKEEQERTAKNKVYNACLKIQTTMKLEADIDDFLEYNTTKVRINPKYRSL